MSRHKNADPAIEAAAKQREEEMTPTPVVHESFEAMQERTEADRKGTNEDPSITNDPTRARFESMEKAKDEQNKLYLKQHDGKAKV